MSENRRIVSGMRPTGPLHLGHYFGVLKNWVALQEDYQCFFFIADWHALTTEYAEPKKIKGFVPELVLDWIASGLDPEKCVLFQQSKVPEHAELSLALSMITPVSWLERCPTYKEQCVQLAHKDVSSYGFLGYPVLMSADILLYRPAFVPVGHDQLPHLEMTREIARRANFLWGEFFPEPQHLLTETSKLVGLDGRKMSKSYGNAISLSDDPKAVLKKIKGMVTCTLRARLTDPGDPAQCNLYPYLEIFVDESLRSHIPQGCTSASIGCGECKKLLGDAVMEFLTPIHERRSALAKRPKDIHDILDAGNEKARHAARDTMTRLKKLIGFNY